MLARMRLLVIVVLVAVSHAFPLDVAATPSQVNPPIATSLWDVTGFGGKYVVAGGACDPRSYLTVSVSTDLKSWTNQDLTDVPSESCNNMFDTQKNWATASDPKLGYAIYNGVSYYFSADGNTWKWNNNTEMGSLVYVSCNGQGTCLAALQDIDGKGNFGWALSSDLLNWTPFKTNAALSGYPKTINGQFMLISSDWIYLYNANLSGWQAHFNLTAQLLPFQNVLIYDMTAGPNNNFLILGSFPNSLLKGLFLLSSDGKSIQDIAVFEASVSGMIYSNGVLMTYSSTSYNVTKNLGANWQTYSCVPSSDDPYKHCSASLVNGNFVVLGSDGFFMYSADGLVWTPAPSGFMGDISGLSVKDDEFYLFSTVRSQYATTVYAYTSTDGVSWNPSTTFQPPANIAYLYQPVYYPSITSWVCMFFNDTGYYTFPRISTDLQQWQSMDLPVPESRVASIVFGNGIWMLSGENDAYQYLIYSKTATAATWNTTTPTKPREYSGPIIAFGNGIFVVLSGNFTMTTTDAHVWTTSPVPSVCSYIQFVGNTNGLFFCGAGLRPPHAVSKDGANWETIVYSTPPPALGTSSVVLYDGNQYYVTYEFESVMFASTDGLRWSQTDSVSFLGLSFSATINNVGVVAGNVNNEAYVVK